MSRRPLVRHAARFLGLAAVLLLLGAVAYAQEDVPGLTWEPGIRAVTTLAPIADAAGRIAREEGLGLRPGLSLLGTDVQPEGTTAVSITLDAGTHYEILAAVDEGAELLALEVFGPEEDGDAIATDTVVSGAAGVADFVAEAPGDYTIAVTPSGNTEPAFVSVLILEEGGLPVSAEQIGRACGALIGACQACNDEADLTWHDDDNEWCFVGGLMAPNEEYTLPNVFLGENQYAFVACDSGPSADLDIKVWDSDANVLATDGEDGAIAVATLEGPVEGVNVTFNGEGAADDAEPTFAICGLLRLL